MFLAVPQTCNSVLSSHSGQSARFSSISRSPPISQTTDNPSMQSLSSQSKQQLKNLRSIQNGYYVAKLYERFQHIDRVLFVLLVVNVLIIAAYTELELMLVDPIEHKQSVMIITDQMEIKRVQNLVDAILWMNFALTCITIPVSLFRQSLQDSYLQVQNKYTEPINQFYQLLFIIIQPLPFLNNIQIQLQLQKPSDPPISIKLNLLLVILSILKSLLIVRHLFWQNLCLSLDFRSQKFFKPSYNRICKIYSCNNNYIHIMKCLFRENFIVFIGGFYLICMATCAYCLRIVQGHFDGRFLNILNCMWFTLMSMTTVGYGDLFVVTPIGVAIDGFLMFSGVVIVSLLVSSLNGLLTLGYREKRALTLLKRLKDKAQLKKIASTFIARCVERNWLQKKTNKSLPISEEERISCRKFNQLRMQLKCGKQKQLNLYRDMLNQFESLKLQLQELMDTCEDDISTLAEKQRLTLNRDSRRQCMRHRSSSYFNLIKFKSRDSRLSMMEKSFGKMKEANEMVRDYLSEIREQAKEISDREDAKDESSSQDSKQGNKDGNQRGQNKKNSNQNENSDRIRSYITVEELDR